MSEPTTAQPTEAEILRRKKSFAHLLRNKFGIEPLVAEHIACDFHTILLDVTAALASAQEGAGDVAGKMSEEHLAENQQTWEKVHERIATATAPAQEERSGWARQNPDPNCSECKGTGFFGDNGPGRHGHHEYTRCDCTSVRGQQPAPAQEEKKAGEWTNLDGITIEFSDGKGVQILERLVTQTVVEQHNAEVASLRAEVKHLQRELETRTREVIGDEFIEHDIRLQGRVERLQRELEEARKRLDEIHAHAESALTCDLPSTESMDIEEAFEQISEIADRSRPLDTLLNPAALASPSPQKE